ncbi:MAG: rane protein of unknown function [Modestobacter sp.]|jgi:hypothetical protein|nr:rane protein of unknown function [Modestobacter sp.]
MSRRPGGRLTTAGILAVGLAVVSLGLTWSPGTAGTGTPARVAIVAAIALVGLGLTRGRAGLLPVAVLVGAVGVVLGGVTPSPGRLVLAAAVACLAVGLRADGRRVLPGS